MVVEKWHGGQTISLGQMSHKSSTMTTCIAINCFFFQNTINSFGLVADRPCAEQVQCLQLNGKLIIDNMAGTFTFLKGKRQACQVLVDEENHQVYHKNVIKVLGLYITMREERMTWFHYLYLLTQLQYKQRKRTIRGRGKLANLRWSQTGRCGWRSASMIVSQEISDKSRQIQFTRSKHDEQHTVKESPWVKLGRTLYTKILYGCSQ